MPGQTVSTVRNKGRKWKKPKNAFTKEQYKALMRIMHGSLELKANDINPINQTAYLGAANIHHISDMGQGDDDDEVVGRQIVMKSVHTRFSFVKIAGSPSQGSFRVILFQDMDQPSVAPVVVDVLQVANYLAPYQHNTRTRMKILEDRTLNLDDDDPITELIFTTTKFGSRKIQWFGTPISGVNISAKGHLYVLVITDGNFAAPASALKYDLYSRINYYDA